MSATSTSDLAGKARTLSDGAAKSGDSWDFFERSALYREYLRQLEETQDIAAFRDFVVRPQDFEPQHVVFPALKRIAALVDPNPYLYLLIHRFAEWVGTADVDEKYDWAERAANLAPDDAHVLWDLFFARGDDTPERQAEVLDRLARAHPEDRRLVDLLRGSIETHQVEPYNAVKLEVRGRELSRDAIFDSLQPREPR
jgi:hypothetical protein